MARRPRRPEESKRKRSEEGDEQVGNTGKDNMIMFTFKPFFTSGIEKAKVQCETEAGWIQFWKLEILDKCFVGLDIIRLLYFLFCCKLSSIYLAFDHPP